MLDWHNPEHVVRPIRRISRMVGLGASVWNIAREIACCTPLCRRCHMTEDGRIISVQRLHAKLNPEQVLEIRRLAGTMPYTKLAQRYGVRPAIITKIVLRQVWSNLPEERPLLPLAGRWRKYMCPRSGASVDSGLGKVTCGECGRGVELESGMLPAHNYLTKKERARPV